MGKVKELSIDLDTLVQAVLEIPNELSADLESGSAWMNESASKKFALEHRILLEHLHKLVELANAIDQDEVVAQLIADARAEGL